MCLRWLGGRRASPSTMPRLTGACAAAVIFLWRGGTAPVRHPDSVSSSWSLRSASLPVHQRFPTSCSLLAFAGRAVAPCRFKKNVSSRRGPGVSLDLTGCRGQSAQGNDGIRLWGGSTLLWAGGHISCLGVGACVVRREWSVITGSASCASNRPPFSEGQGQGSGSESTPAIRALRPSEWERQPDPGWRAARQGTRTESAGVSSRAGSPSPWKCRGYVSRGGHRSSVSVGALGFAQAPSLPLGRLLIVSCSLHIADQTLLLAQLLETSDHLLYGLAGSHLYFQH